MPTPEQPTAARAPRRRPRGRVLFAAVAAGVALALTGCQPASYRTAGLAQVPGSPISAPTTPPTVDVATVGDGLGAPSSVVVAPGGTVLVTSGTRIVGYEPDGTHSTIAHDLTDVATGKAGLLDIAVAPEYPKDPRIYLCYRTDSDIRIAAMTTGRDLTKAVSEPPILAGLPLPASETGGCRIAFGPDGFLYVGTSDGADPQASQDLSSLGGKILRLDAAARQPAPTNPFIDRSDPNARLVYSYGHREITGLAWHPTTAALYAIERGPGREDEINLIVPGGNYGWNPASKSQRDYRTDDVAMTDLSIPNARPAAWNSGAQSPGLGPATFVQGSQWGTLAASLAVSNVTGPRVLFLPVTGEVVGHPVTLNTLNPIGPTAAICQDDAGDLLILTASGGNDRLARASVVN